MSAKTSIEHGNEYPFDAPDAWWHSISGSPPPPSKDWAHAAARGIIADLRDRKGIKRSLDISAIDEETRAEIVETIAAIIREAEQGRP